VGISLENMYNTLHRFVLIMAAVFPLGLLLAGGGGWLLAKRALRPVDHMTRAAQRISGEHLEERLMETGTGDELDRLARTLNQMLGRLDDSFRQVRRFSADASHELQTPLTILKGEIEVSLRSPRSPEEYQRVLRSSLEEIERISRLVEGLMLLARADSGVLRLDLKPVELNRLVAEVSAQMQRLADDKGVALHLDALEPITVCGDKEHLVRPPVFTGPRKPGHRAAGALAWGFALGNPLRKLTAAKSRCTAAPARGAPSPLSFRSSARETFEKARLRQGGSLVYGWQLRWYRCPHLGWRRLSLAFTKGGG
ncbi:MAG: histidine kinase dimerization/phospho-acceptor domain-containing protein, partial [Syntrophobacterales bacterium]